jgi:hypothetical protein
MRLVRKRGLPRGVATWNVVDQPFLVVALPTGWLVVALDDDARRALIGQDLLGRRFATRAAAVEALSTAAASHGARRMRA